MNIKSRIRQWRVRQRGIVLILVVAAMTCVLGMAGVAMDFGLAFLTKTRVQNALDAAALAGAKVLKSTGSTTTATNDARTAFNYYLGQLNRGSLTPTVQFSMTLTPFTPVGLPLPAGSPAPNFIRVRMPAGYTIPTYLTRVFPGVGDTLALGGSAVAGPISLQPPPELCDLVPIVVYDSTGDSDCSDNTCFGYTINSTVQLKADTAAGNGNFSLMIPPGYGAGGNQLRRPLAGESIGCQAPATITTEPGGTNGPFQSLDLRFGLNPPGNLSNTEFPPDVNTNPYTSYANYLAATAAGVFTNPPTSGSPAGRYDRRLIRVVFSRTVCSGRCNRVVSGFGCFFLLDKVTGSGVNQRIPGQFLRSCPIQNGQISNAALGPNSFFKIVLYRDPNSQES